MRAKPPLAIVLFLVLSCTGASLPAQWHVLQSPPDYRSMVELSTARNTEGFQRFALRRDYPSPQTDRGQTFLSTVEVFLADCGSLRSLVVLKLYQAENDKVVHTIKRDKFRRGEFRAPKEGSDAEEALIVACKHIASKGS